MAENKQDSGSSTPNSGNSSSSVGNSNSTSTTGVNTSTTNDSTTTTTIDETTTIQEGTLNDSIYKITNWGEFAKDDNNDYIDLENDKINCVQLLEPTIAVSEFVVENKDRLNVNNLPERMAFRVPVI